MNDTTGQPSWFRFRDATASLLGMPSIDTVDRRIIRAPAETLFDTILDYPRMREWFPSYRIDVVGGGPVREGSRLAHELTTMGLKTTFTRTIRNVTRPRSIEETYDEGMLLGEGRWQFDERGPDDTEVSFFCKVRSNALATHVGLLLTGARGHNRVYQDILAALKKRAEAGA